MMLDLHLHEDMRRGLGFASVRTTTLYIVIPMLR